MSERSVDVGIPKRSPHMWRLLDRGAPDRAKRRVTTPRRAWPEPERTLRCALCSHAVTPVAARTQMNGAHRHTFFNPAGQVFDVGCFTHAPGCTTVGDASDFFSWFPGYPWRVSVCRGCTAHLGWAYGGGPDFWGLIVDRLVEGDGGDD